MQDAISEIRFSYGDGVLEMSGSFGYDVGDVKIARMTVLGHKPVVKTVDVPLTMGCKIELGVHLARGTPLTEARDRL